MLNSARAEAEVRLSQIAATSPSTFDGTVLLDGQFDNANYWYRLALLRSALGLPAGREVGITGPHTADAAARTFARFGISEISKFDAAATQQDRRLAKKLMQELVSDSMTARDVLGWSLPHAVPAALVYDGLLKEQRLPSVDPAENLFQDRVLAALLQIFSAYRLIEKYQPSLLILSHGCNVRYGALAHLALQSNVPVVVAFGNYGLPRFYRLHQPTDLFDPMDCPRGKDLDALSEERSRLFAAIGRQYLDARLSGATDDIGGQYAFSNQKDQQNRAEMAAHFNWNPDKPLVAIYAANWFDYPHYMGMKNFCDFRDLISVTLAEAAVNDNVNWIFRRHPADDYYGGTTLKDVMPKELPSHVVICPETWSSTSVMSNVDAIVTCHGTVGVEAAALGVPVLVADRGWYHDCGFVTWAEDRQAYVAKLNEPWWKDVNIEFRRRRAEIFAGWYFAMPRWQRGLVCADDSLQARNYQRICRMLDTEAAALSRELDEISRWWRSGARFYHTSKMAQAERFALSNVIRGNGGDQ